MSDCSDLMKNSARQRNVARIQALSLSQEIHFTKAKEIFTHTQHNISVHSEQNLSLFVQLRD